METKRFIGSDLRRLYARVRDEFGPDAIIVRTRSLTRDGAEPLVELVAAPPHAEHELSLEFQWRLLEGAVSRLQYIDPHATVGDLEDMLAREEAAVDGAEDAPADPLTGDWFEGFVAGDVPAQPPAQAREPELVRLPAPRAVPFGPLEAIEDEPPPPNDWASRPRPAIPVFERVPRPALGRSPSLRDRLTEAGLSQPAADAVVRLARRESDPVRALAIALDAREATYPDESQTALITIDGPAQAGRTSALLRMALDCADAGREAILVAADTSRESARAELHAGGRRLRIPVVDAASPGELRLLAARSNPGACLFVDTPAGLFEPPRTTAVHYSYLALPAGRGREEFEHELEPFLGSRFAGCVITEVDRATDLSPVISTVVSLGLGVAFLSSGTDITTGVRVPDSIELASGIFQRTSGVRTNGRLVASA